MKMTSQRETAGECTLPMIGIFLGVVLITVSSFMLYLTTHQAIPSYCTGTMISCSYECGVDDNTRDCDLVFHLNVSSTECNQTLHRILSIPTVFDTNCQEYWKKQGDTIPCGHSEDDQCDITLNWNFLMSENTRIAIFAVFVTLCVLGCSMILGSIISITMKCRRRGYESIRMT